MLAGVEYRLKSAADLSRRDTAALEKIGNGATINVLAEHVGAIFYDEPPELSLLQLSAVYQHFLVHCQASLTSLGLTG